MTMTVRKYDLYFRVHAALGLERATVGKLLVLWNNNFFFVAILQYNMVGGKNGGVYSSAAPLSPETFRYFQVL